MIESYEKLLISQYWRSPKARADIALRLGTLAPIADVLLGLADAFDVDQAVGRQLDIIGRIVGLNRRVQTFEVLEFFGFHGHAGARGFGQAPFYRRGELKYGWTTLGDESYRRFLKAKIAINNVKAKMIAPDYLSIQGAIQLASDGRAWVVDNYDMSLTLYVDPGVPLSELRLLFVLGLLARPQGVYYNVIQAAQDGYFGFASNPNAKGFGVGTLARKFLGGYDGENR